MITVTLDTNVLIDGTELDSDPEKRLTYRALSEFSHRGTISIGLTSRLHEDKQNDKDLARVRRQLREAARYRTIPGPFRIGVSRLGVDTFVDETLLDSIAQLFGAKYDDTGRLNTLWDVDHLYGHAIAKRDYFVTYERRILNKAPQLLALGIRAWDPRPFSQAVQLIESTLRDSEHFDALFPVILDRAFRGEL